MADLKRLVTPVVDFAGEADWARMRDVASSSPLIVNNTVVRTDSNGLFLRGSSGAIVVIRHGDTEHVLGVTEHAITPISSAAAPKELADDSDSTIDLRDDAAESSRRPGLAGRLDALRERTVRH